MQVLDYCRLHLGQAFEWGRADCAHFAAGWAVAGLGARPVPVPRLTANGARRVAYRTARLLRVARRWARCAGLAIADGAPGAGDIGVILFEDGAGFAIHTGASWAARAEGGFGLLEADHLLLMRRA